MHSAGESVSALTAEMSTAALIVTANWRNSSPEMPAMKAIGTNTDSSTRVMPTIGAGHLRHRLLGRFRRRQVRLFLHHSLDVLDHDDRVVHHDADREHQRQQRDGVGRITKRKKNGETSNQTDRNGNDRNNGCAQIAEKQEHDDGDQNKCLDKRLE